MDFEPDASHEFLINTAQERTACRTRNLLTAARLAFLFSHGAFVVVASIALGQEDISSWWAVFTPLWFGDGLCGGLIVLSWFASCPYVQLCMSEHQARLGDDNPSILTEILPDIVLSILGLLFLVLSLAGELMLCWYLDGRCLDGAARPLEPAAAIFIAVSLLTCCRGVCIQTSSELFGFVGGGALGMSLAMLLVPGGPLGASGWVLLVPPFLSAAGLLASSVRRLHRCSSVLTQEERYLRLLEQAALLIVVVSLLLCILVLALGTGAGYSCSIAVGGGVAAGASLCAIAGLRGRMAVLECRTSRVSERLLTLSASSNQCNEAMQERTRSAMDVIPCAEFSTIALGSDNSDP